MESDRQSLERQIRTWELLAGELAAELRNDPESRPVIQLLKNDESRVELAAQVAQSDPDNPYAANEPFATAEYESLVDELGQVLATLEADADLADNVKTARQGADPVVLGELQVAADLAQNLANFTIPAAIALLLAARVKQIKIGKFSVEFFKGVPKRLADFSNGILNRLPPG